VVNILQDYRLMGCRIEKEERERLEEAFYLPGILKSLARPKDHVNFFDINLEIASLKFTRR